MRILINVNEQISATMMEKHFQASNLEAEVTAAPNNMMLEILKACKIDLLAYYAEEVDNADLISFFNLTGDVRKILFVKKQNLGLVSAELEEMLDECFTIPLDSNDVMIRLRRMFRAAEQKKAEVPLQPQQPIPVVQVQPPAQYIAPPPATQEQPQPLQYQPPAQNTQPVPTYVNTPPVATPPLMQNEPAVRPVEKEQPITPIQTAYTYTPESFRQEPAGQTDFIAQQPAMQPLYTTELRGSYEPPDAVPVQPQNSFVHSEQSEQSKKTGEKSLAMRIVAGISKSLFYILVFIVAVLAVFMVKSKISGGTPSVLGYQLYGVLSGSMNGTQKTSFDTGSLVFVKAIDVQKIEVGDIITFRGLSIDAPLTTHRVVGINNEDSLSFVTRGDANSVNDPKPISAEKVVGTVRGHLPFIGYLTGFAETRTGLIFLVFVPGAIIITYELFNIYRTLKNDKKKRKDD